MCPHGKSRANMISANETQNGKHFRLFPVTETRNVALELGAGGAGRGGVGTAHEPATEARPTQAPRAASPAHASWQSWPCPGPGPGCSPPPASAPRGCHGNLRSGSEATHAPQAKPRFPGLETWKQALPPRPALEDAPNVSQRLRVIFAETGHSTDSLSLAIWADPPSGL